MKSGTDVNLGHDYAVQSWGAPVPRAEGRYCQAVLKPARPDQHPLQDLMLALFAGGRFRFDLSLRIQAAGFEQEMAFTGVSAGSALPNGETHHLLIGLRESLPFSFSGERRQNIGSGPLTRSELVRFGEVEIDFRKMELRRRGQRIKTTAQEFMTLRYLVSHPEEAISRDELLEKVWGYRNYPTTRTVDNRILRLRQKLERDPAQPAHLLTVHGVGYKFVP